MLIQPTLTYAELRDANKEMECCALYILQGSTMLRKTIKADTIEPCIVVEASIALKHKQLDPTLSDHS